MVDKKAIIVLHEIYGINNFISTQCLWYEHMGFDVLCPNMIERKCLTMMMYQMHIHNLCQILVLIITIKLIV